MLPFLVSDVLAKTLGEHFAKATPAVPVTKLSTRSDPVVTPSAVLVKRNSTPQAKSGVHTLFCVSDTAAGAEGIAADAHREVTMMEPAVKKALDLREFTVPWVSRLELVDDTHYVVRVGVAWTAGDY